MSTRPEAAAGKPGRTPRLPDRKELILAAAGQLFATHGYHGSSMRDLARICNLQPGSLYSHFPRKEVLLEQLVDRYLDSLLPRLHAAADGTEDGANRLSAMIHATVSVSVAYPSEFLSLSNNWRYISNAPELAGLIRRRDEGNELWRQVITEGQGDGSLRLGITPDDALWVIFSAITGLVDGRYGDLTATSTDPAETMSVVRRNAGEPNRHSVEPSRPWGTALILSSFPRPTACKGWRGRPLAPMVGHVPVWTGSMRQ
jgi:AcrR family transcriptional regulator